MHRSTASLLVLGTFLLSCSTSPGLDELSDTWKFHGLNSVVVHSIHERNGQLYAGTDQGVYISTDLDRTSWKGPKLDIAGIQYISLVLGEEKEIIAAVQYEPEFFDEKNKVLFGSSDDGESWEAINATIEGAKWEGRPVSSLITLKYLEPQSPNLNVFFGYNGVISRSTD